MRARSLKPAICDNELLGTADPYCTLMFERLWMMADREGRLEDRPLRIKAQAFPYRDGLDVEPLLGWLDEQRFIKRYVIDEVPYIQVLKFAEHQKPHQNEKPSVIPKVPRTSDQGTKSGTTKAPSEHNQGTKSSPDTTKEQSTSDQNTKHLALTPSSLTPDSGLLTPENPACDQEPSRGTEGKGNGSSPKHETEAPTLHASLPLDVWNEWLAWRRKKRWPIDRTTLTKQLNILASFTTEEQRKAINDSIQSGWQGIFAPKGGTGNRKTRFDEAMEKTRVTDEEARDLGIPY